MQKSSCDEINCNCALEIDCNVRLPSSPLFLVNTHPLCISVHPLWLWINICGTEVRLKHLTRTSFPRKIFCQSANFSLVRWLKPPRAAGCSSKIWSPAQYMQQKSVRAPWAIIMRRVMMLGRVFRIYNKVVRKFASNNVRARAHIKR